MRKWSNQERQAHSKKMHEYWKLKNGKKITPGRRIELKQEPQHNSIHSELSFIRNSVEEILARLG